MSADSPPSPPKIPKKLLYKQSFSINNKYIQVDGKSIISPAVKLLGHAYGRRDDEHNKPDTSRTVSIGIDYTADINFNPEKLVYNHMCDKHDAYVDLFLQIADNPHGISDALDIVADELFAKYQTTELTTEAMRAAKTKSRNAIFWWLIDNVRFVFPVDTGEVDPQYDNPIYKSKKDQRFRVFQDIVDWVALREWCEGKGEKPPNADAVRTKKWFSTGKCFTYGGPEKGKERHDITFGGETLRDRVKKRLQKRYGETVKREDWGDLVKDLKELGWNENTFLITDQDKIPIKGDSRDILKHGAVIKTIIDLKLNKSAEGTLYLKEDIKWQVFLIQRAKKRKREAERIPEDDPYRVQGGLSALDDDDDDDDDDLPPPTNAVSSIFNDSDDNKNDGHETENTTTSEPDSKRRRVEEAHK